MNDLNYIFYKPKLMLTDCLDICDPETELAHRRLCDYVWAMDRPPKADDRFLRQFTRATDSSWGRIKRGLMDKGWFESGGLLLHRGAIAALNEAALKFAENHNRTAAAGGRPLMVGTADSLTGIVTYAVTTPETVPVTPAVTQPVTSGQRKGEDRKGKEGGETSDYSLSSKVVLGGLGGIVTRLLRNQDGWAYDNCKVQPGDFTAAQLTALIRPYVGKLTGKLVVAAWQSAVLKAHRDAVDGMILKNAAASCVDEFKRQLAQRSEPEKTPA